ncbi:hypothetical protein [Pseudomonas mosselii]|uniref:hypothetical protein n=1 Tax=Pseudomonas mosselii TaxID=78327 RepID=UPI0021D94A51|nr:hypothetical protein [Pseudomonas mosselii]MCU9530417.1 hypothetical protein [Pseudomonas mosselii]MCU9537590.1 hypothetical protein [Pseudomonas mosselii]MCU9543545.1 hypothetical protein [Pseudomonas mosselii]MCU9549476.1 hypothetical protein [Pseudomonas mosselii]
METADYTIMLTQLSVMKPAFSGFWAFNVVCTLFVLTTSAVRFSRNKYILARLSFCFPLFVSVFYQVPLVIFSGQLDRALAEPWAYALVVNGGAVALVAWGGLSRRFDFKAEGSEFPAAVNGAYSFTALAGAALVFVYLWRVSWECSGLYALMYDPWMTLLAREFSVKLIGTSISTYALGAYVNTVAPMLALLSIWLLKASVPHHPLRAIIAVLIGFLAILAVLISGTKGLLVSSMLMLLAGAFFWCRTWISRLLMGGFAVAFVMASLVAFEVLKERESVVGGRYDFAACSVKAGTCQKSKELIDSLALRDYSLGLPSKYIAPISTRLECLCGSEVGEEQCSPGVLLSPSQSVAESSGQDVKVTSDQDVIIAPVQSIATVPAQSVVIVPEHMQKQEAPVVQVQEVAASQNRHLIFLQAIFNRMLVIPFQVSVWNFMYAESEEVDGFKTLPFARRVLGESVNIPELVYQKFGSVYAEGDKTSTSTAPTSFFLVYPAFLGVMGMAIALLAIIVLDLILARLASSMGSGLIPILVGVVLIMCVNFMSSDYITVLMSHGGIAGLLMLSFYTLLLKKNSR